MGFNRRGDQYYILQDPFNLKIYAASNNAVKFWVVTQEKILDITFSSQREDFFVITEKGRVKKYKLNENTNDIKLYREYSALHNGDIYSIQASANCKYIFTTGEDNTIKVWDYHFRGGLVPAYQAYNCGERVEEVILSNDRLQLVLSFSRKNKTLYCWKFFGNIHEWTDTETFEQIESTVEQQYQLVTGNLPQADIQEVSEKNIFSNLSKDVQPDGNYQEAPDQQPPQQQLKGLYDIVEKQWEGQGRDASGQPAHSEQHSRPTEPNKEGRYQISQNNAETEHNHPGPGATLPAQEEAEEEGKQRDTFPGSYIQRQYVLGFNCGTNFPQADIIWHQAENYYVLPCNEAVVISNMCEQR